MKGTYKGVITQRNIHNHDILETIINSETLQKHVKQNHTDKSIFHQFYRKYL